jgi:phospholipid/cholesterol/gamma-HCH transport system substrate-binding protein
MRVTRRVRYQFVAFIVIALIAGGIMAVQFAQLPRIWFGAGVYQVTLELPAASGLYPSSNVTYLGTEVGRVDEVQLSPAGVEAHLSLTSGIDIPSNLRAEVHSVSAIGEQYVALTPLDDSSAPLAAGDIIPRDHTSSPVNINDVLVKANRGLQAIPHDNLKTVIDESYIAFGGLGPDLARLVDGSTKLAIDARTNLGSITTLIDESKPILDSQSDSSDSIAAWSANLASITQQLRDKDAAFAGILQNGPAAAGEVRQLFDRLNPTLPIVLANLVSVDQVALTYRANLEQLLVLLPQATAITQMTDVPDRNGSHPGAWQNFNLNLNIPPPCTTGFPPPQQQRSSALVDTPPRPDGDIYCRIPQDAPFNVRGTRNIPCETVPGKRAPTVKMCESDQNYVPLNDGTYWKGDPNATLAGQAVPEPPVTAPPMAGTQPAPPAPPVIAAVDYDPDTGDYVGPDGQVYVAADLARTSPSKRTLESMMLPPKTN